MNLLQTVERQLGGLIETWPSNIIRLLFELFPSPSNIKQLAAFFCGNNVPEYYANKLCTTCYGSEANDVVYT